MEKKAKQFLLYALFIIVAVLSVQLFVNDVNNMLSEKQPFDPLLNFKQSDSKNYIQPIPLSLNLDADKVKLGEMMFHDVTISPNNVSCSSCHKLEKGGVDNLKTSVNIQGGFDEMNTQTVFNCAFNPKLFWNGRLSTLKEQLDDVIHNHKHLNSNWAWIVKSFKQNPAYNQLANKIYGESLNKSNISDAIITFEQSLYTPNSRFDQYLRGNKTAISEDEKKGYQLFKDYGCISCHQGINIGGNLLAKFGVYYNPFNDKKVLTATDLGLYSITHQEKDKHVFRVPSLRNVEKTAPYFHNGSKKTLEEAIKLMAKAQLGQNLPDNDIKLIAKFLRTLTGQYKGKDL